MQPIKLKATLAVNRGGLLAFNVQYNPNIEADELTVTVKPYKKDRSLEQNSRLWKGLELLSEQTGQDKDELYIHILKKAGVYKIESITPENYEFIKRAFRDVEILQVDEENNRLICKVVLGSSQYDVLEMTELLRHLSQELAYYNIDF